jgi:glycolate oxidase FAD binding subunit
MQTPATVEELTHVLRAAGAHKQTVSLSGAGSKRLMAGPIEDAIVNLSLAGLDRVLEYEPRDLTISVEAGMPWRKLMELVGSNRQMIPLDPPFADLATVGGVVATNSSGPRRRLYGTARDLVIGMRFLTLEGKAVQSGGMVVKNVAGLDMGKLMIGSFGTLAAIATVNFKLIPAPEGDRSFLLAFDTLAAAAAARDGVLKSVLQPSALDLLSPAAAESVGRRSWVLAMRVGGNAAVIDRYEREFSRLGEGVALDGAQHRALWQRIPALDGAAARRRRGQGFLYPEGNGGTPQIIRRPLGLACRLGYLLPSFRAARSGGRLDARRGRARLEGGGGILWGGRQERSRAVAGPGNGFRGDEAGQADVRPRWTVEPWQTVSPYLTS